MSIDETTDVEERYIANVIIGTLLSHGPSKIFLLPTKVLEKSNFSTTIKIFDNANLFFYDLTIYVTTMNNYFCPMQHLT